MHAAGTLIRVADARDTVVDAAQAIESLASPAGPLRNGHLAVGAHPVTGTPFDAAGYPDFSDVAKTQVTITLTGAGQGVFHAANTTAGHGRTPAGYTWHHHQDGRTRRAVRGEIHATTGSMDALERKP